VNLFSDGGFPIFTSGQLATSSSVKKIQGVLNIMSDEIDKEVTSRKVTSTSNTPRDGFRVTEQHTTQARNVDNSATGVIVVVLAVLAVGAGFTAYYLNNRPNPSIVVPGATNTVKENKTTIIERNNTTSPSPVPAPAPAPNIDINVPTQPVPNVNVNVPPPTVIVPKVDVNVAPAEPPTTTFTIPPTTN